MRSFSEVYPDLVKEWSPENELTPDKVSYGSNKAIMWSGSCGHTWTATPKNRGHNHGCPICSGNLIKAGVNDLASKYPDVAKEWSDKNYPSLPSEFGPKSNKEVWWKCSTCGKEWSSRIADRTDGHGCPHCLKDRIRDRKNARTEAHRLQILQSWRTRQIKRSLKDDDFRLMALAFYASQAGSEVRFDHDYGIGVPVQLYFPEKCAAIELTSYMNEGWADWRCENAKNWLCINTGVKMVRIIPKRMKSFPNCKCVRMKNETADALDYAIRQAFKSIKIPMDIDIVRDYDEIRRQKHDED